MNDPDTCPVQENDGSFARSYRDAYTLWWESLTPRERALEIQRQYEHRRCATGGCCS